MKKIISIEGMSCNHCVTHVREALEEMDGVNVIDVSLDSKSAIVETTIDNEILIKAIEDEGYEVNSIE